MEDLMHELNRLESYLKQLYKEAQMSDLANQEYIKVKEQIRNLKSLLKGRE